MTENLSVWSHPRLVWRTWSYLASAVSSALGKSARQIECESYEEFKSSSAPPRAEIDVCLPTSLAYTVETDTRTQLLHLQRKMALSGDLPASPRTEPVYRIHRPAVHGGSRIQTLMVSEETLQEIEETAARRKCVQIRLSSEANPNWFFETPRTQKHTINRQTWALVSWGVLLLAILFGSNTIIDHKKHELSAIQEQARELRDIALQRNALRDQTNALDAFALSRPEAKTPQSRLEILSRLSVGTSTSAYWRSLMIEQHRIKIAISGADQMDVLRELQTNFPEYSVSFDGSVRASSEGLQLFDIRMDPEEGEG